MNDPKAPVFPFAEPGKFTPFPNHIFDVIMPLVSPNAFKVLCFVIRKTRGYHKATDELSYSQIQKGTGIGSTATVRKALVELLDGKYILQKKGAQFDTASYALNLEYQPATTKIGVEPTSKNEVAPEIGVEPTSEFEAATATVFEAVPTSEIEDTKRKYLNKESKETAAAGYVRTARTCERSFSEENSFAETPASAAPQPSRTSDRVSLQPLPQYEIELTLCEIAGVTNPHQTAPRDREEWPGALDVVQRTGASAEELRAFYNDWFAIPDAHGQLKHKLFLSNIVFHLPQFIARHRAIQQAAAWQQVNTNPNFSGDHDGPNRPGHASYPAAAPRSGLREQRRNSRECFYREYAKRFGSENGFDVE